MASIFLSYAREDAAKAGALAKCLERAGHSVWWDRHIQCGAEFAGEIEAALGQADAVLVLWSKASIRSAWVRDEAAEGRDSGRLVPVLIDDCLPPLGFRQLQSIPATGWSGRGNPPNCKQILAALSARSGPAESPAPAAVPEQRRHRPLLVGLAGLAAIFAAVAGWWLLGADRSEASEPPVLAVLPFSDLSPGGDKAYFAEGVAEAILTVLAKEPGIRVIGRTTAEQLHNASANERDMREALGVTHLLEGSARSVGNQLRMSVRLIDASDGRQLWAEEYQRRLDNIFAVQDEIGRSVVQKLRGSLAGGLQAVQPITKADNYALYLAARAKMRDRRTSALKESLELARRVIAADPNYAPGHALYGELVWLLSTDNYGTIPEPEARRIAERHARRAIALAPEAPDGYAALGVVLSEAGAIAPLKKAIQLDPARAELRQWLGHSYADLGRHEEALEQFRSAVEMDPLWVPGTMLLAYTLGASERYEEAEQTVALFERRGGSPAVAAKIRGDIANYRGDYSEAARLQHRALALDAETPQADLSAGWYNYILGLHDRAEAVTARLPHYSRMQMSGKQSQLLPELRQAGAAIWQQPDPSVAFDVLAFARDWETLAALANPEGISRLCDNYEGTQPMINFAMAAKMTGRKAEAQHLLQCARARLTQQGRSPIRSSYLPVAWMAGLWAQVHAIEGDAGRAFALMNRAVDHGARTPFGRGLSDLPAFDQLRSDPAYGRLDARLKRLIAQERAEALANIRRAA